MPTARLALSLQDCPAECFRGFSRRSGLANVYASLRMTLCLRRPWLERAAVVRHDRRLPVTRSSLERAKELTKQITAADDWRHVASLLREYEEVNLRHLTTAMYFLTKKNQSGEIGHHGGFHEALLDELKGIADRIIQSEESWSSASLANVLQACSRLAGSRSLEATSSFDALRSVALGHLATGVESPLSNVEYLTILSCMVHVSDSPSFPEKKLATKAMEAALFTSDNGPVQLRTKGLVGFHPRDLGPLAWALTEVKCSEETAQLVFDHSMTIVGAKNLSASGLCLTCRMISMQGARGRAQENLNRIVAGLEQPIVLRRLLSLRDSTMLLLGMARMMKTICEDDVKVEQSMSFGVKWTFAVVAYRKAHPHVDRLVNILCTFIERALMFPPNLNGHSNTKEVEVSHGVYSSILYSLALLQHPSTDIITVCTRGLINAGKKLTLRTIATSIWSLAVLRYDEPRVLRVFAKRIVASNLLQSECDSKRHGKKKPRVNISSRSYLDMRDIAQSVSMLLYGFAVLNLLEDENCENMEEMVVLLATVMKTARLCLPHLGPEALPVFGWSIVIAHSKEGSMDNEVFESTMRAWRRAVADSFSDIPEQGRPMIHHTEIALSLEAPEIKGVGVTEDLPFQSLMELLYTSGRLRRHALREWNIQSRSIALDGISLFQKQVFRAAERILPGWQMEYWDNRLQYPVDMALPEQRIVIEADGPTHFMTNVNKPLGATALKRRLLKRLGWRVVIVPFYEWSMNASDDEHDAYIRAKLDGMIAVVEVKVEGHDGGQKQVGPSTQTSVQQAQTLSNSIRSNASMLDTIRAARGKITVKEAMKRRILRGADD